MERSGYPRHVFGIAKREAVEPRPPGRAGIKEIIIMRSPASMDTIQVDVTNACLLRCNGCTRFCGHHTKPFFMSMDDFKQAVDSLVGFALERNGVVGIMGGEPTLAPLFPDYVAYAKSKIPRANLGLWSIFPETKKHYREIICEAFGNILLNDHSRDDIVHAPILMGSEEFFRKACPACAGAGKIHQVSGALGVSEFLASGVVCSGCSGSGTVTDDAALFQAVDKCWVQESWSASIHPKGAYFCEVAAALAETFNGPDGWKVEPGWWKRTPKDFADQMDWACRRCGAAMPIERNRTTKDATDDVSPQNLERLKEIKSRKLARGEVQVHNDFRFDQKLTENHGYPGQTYKDEIYRKTIAARYGIALVMNKRGYWEPRLMEDMPKEEPSLFRILSDKYPVSTGKGVDAPEA